MSGVGSIHDVTSELFLSSQALLSYMSAYVPTKCWFTAYEHVGCRIMCEYQMLCFATYPAFKTLLMLVEAYGKESMKKMKVW
jgi:hypothetical protein